MKLSLPMRNALLLLAEDGDWRSPHHHRNLSRPTFDALVNRGLATQSRVSRNYRITPEGFTLARDFRQWQEDHARLDGAVIEVRRLYEDDALTIEQEQAARSVHALLIVKRDSLRNPMPITIA